MIASRRKFSAAPAPQSPWRRIRSRTRCPIMYEPVPPTMSAVTKSVSIGRYTRISAMKMPGAASGIRIRFACVHQPAPRSTAASNIRLSIAFIAA